MSVTTRMTALLTRSNPIRPGVVGTARVDRDIDRLLRRVCPGDVVVLDVLDLDRITAAREAAQPIREKTGGSTFKNPPGGKAWKLIDEAGCRGLRIGDAQVSEMHCNFLINTGDATATDIEALGEDVRARVKAKFDVELEWEIKRVGVP